MTVIGVDPIQRKVYATDHLYGTDRLHEVMAEADYVVCVAPATKDNQKMIDAAALTRMKRTAYFLNLGTGQSHPYAARGRNVRHLCEAGGDDLPGEPTEIP
jgi:phosphoglycerate dehydrogenase-like enzyme